MTIRIFLISKLLILSLSFCSFCQTKGITRKNFAKTMQGVWTISYYKDTLNKMVFDQSNFVDTLIIKNQGEVIQKRTIIDSREVMIFKEQWEYMDEVKKICKKTVSLVIEGKEIQSESSKDCENVVIKINKDEIILEWFGVLEDNPNIRTKMQSRYIRVDPRFAE